MRWGRVVSVVVLVVIAAIGITVAPLQQSPAAASRYAFVDVMSMDKRDAYLKAHPGAQAAVLNLHPKAIAMMWRTFSKRERHDAAKTYPAVIGQLEGADYVTRDIANRLRLQRLLASTKQKVAKHASDAAAAQKLRSLTAIRAALKPHSPHRYLVDLTNGAKPLAAIAIGKLDSADIVSFTVPGMGTYTDDMQLWAQGAQNVYNAQRAVAHAGTSLAVVAWIGYETPPPGIDAALGEYAHIGARNLIESLDGFWAARGKKAQTSVTLNVIAHSYGTTTSADALAAADLKVYAFVMLGSAGIEPGIGSARRLHARHVYAGEATGDTEAQWGRISRIDPRSPSFGAIPLAVDGDPHKDELPVTGHAPILHSNWNDNPMSSAWAKFTNADEFAERYLNHLSTYGYLDAGTESIENVAAVTVPPASSPHDSTVSPKG
jgi:pimeloyl-ACP methyl ester carboxylesterase